MMMRAVKILSVAVLTAAAILGILFDFRTSSGSLTQWGVVAIVATVVSAVIAVIIELLEFKQEVTESQSEDLMNRERQALLSEIRGSIQSGSQPLTPFQVFCTIRCVREEGVLDKHFANVPGYRSLRKSNLLKQVGVGRLGGPPYNFEEESPTTSQCTIKDSEVLDEMVRSYHKEKSPIWLPDGGVAIGFHRNEIPDEPPFVSFETISLSHQRPGTVREIRLYDHAVYQDTAIVDWKMSSLSEAVLGIRDLEDTTMKVSVAFFAPDHSLDKNPPTLTNLLLYFGVNPTHLLYFPLDRLKASQRAIRQDPRGVQFHWGNDLAKEMLQPLSVQFECRLDKSFFRSHVVRYAK